MPGRARRRSAAGFRASCARECVTGRRLADADRRADRRRQRLRAASSATAKPEQYRQYAPAAQATPGTRAQQAFISLIAPGAVAAQQRWGVPAAVTIAQAIEESSWGNSQLAAKYHNLFGIKGSGPAGSVGLPTSEFYNGQWVTIDAQFRVYHNVAESIADHAELLATSGYYQRAMADRAIPDAFANDLTGVYATDPDYGANLIAIMKLYNLYRFDGPTQSVQPAQSQPLRAVGDGVGDADPGRVAGDDSVSACGRAVGPRSRPPLSRRRARRTPATHRPPGTRQTGRRTAGRRPSPGLGAGPGADRWPSHRRCPSDRRRSIPPPAPCQRGRRACGGVPARGGDTGSWSPRTRWRPARRRQLRARAAAPLPARLLGRRPATLPVRVPAPPQAPPWAGQPSPGLAATAAVNYQRQPARDRRRPPPGTSRSSPPR